MKPPEFGQAENVPYNESIATSNEVKVTAVIVFAMFFHDRLPQYFLKNLKKNNYYISEFD
jgi:hypothetical protein